MSEFASGSFDRALSSSDGGVASGRVVSLLEAPVGESASGRRGLRRGGVCGGEDGSAVQSGGGVCGSRSGSRRIAEVCILKLV